MLTFLDRLIESGIELENSGQGEKQAGDFGQATDQSINAGESENKNTGYMNEDSNNHVITSGIEKENTRQGDKHGGDFGQAGK